MSETVAGATRIERGFEQTALPNSKLGIWIFLASEVMFFAGILGTYIVYRISDPVAFDPDYLARVHARLNVPLAALNTLILITSSFTMALAVQGSRHRDNRAVRKFLLLTALLGLAFCGVKAIEYGEKLGHGIVPGTSIFYSCYFTATGVHLLHVIGGVIPILGLFAVAGNGRFVREGSNTVECMGLYWHFVDVVWIFLFPLFYLIR